MAAGFTQPGATEWYNPAEATEEATADNSDTGSDAQPSRTANSGIDATSTRMTVITQTAEDGAVRTQGKFLLLMVTVPLLLLQVLFLCLSC
jgi:hypothetical protein